MAWYNPATWTPVDNVQSALGQSKRALNSFQGSSPSDPVFSNPAGADYSTFLGSPTAGRAPKVSPGSISSGSTSAPSAQDAPDPYAQYGGRANYDTLVSGFNAQKQGIYGTANEAAANAGIGFKGSILDFIDSLRSGQRSIDTQGVNNELAKRQGTQSILDMVGRGVRSGGVLLANKNAGDSSATGEIARAYGDLGTRQLSSVGNQYEMANNQLTQEQEDLGQQQASGVRKLADSKVQVVNSIVSNARNQLAALDANMANASIPDRIAIEQEKEAIKQQVTGQLQQYDQLLQSETSKIGPSSTDARRAEASRLAGLGTGPTEAFNFTDQAPAQFQNTGPFASELPIFTFGRGAKRQLA